MYKRVAIQCGCKSAKTGVNALSANEEFTSFFSVRDYDGEGKMGAKKKIKTATPAKRETTCRRYGSSLK